MEAKLQIHPSTPLPRSLERVEYVGHASQAFTAGSAPTGQKAAGPQSAQAALPCEALYLPSSQAAHGPPAAPVKPGSHVQSMSASLAKPPLELAVQRSHAVAAATWLKNLPLHAAHGSAFPAAALKKPGAHAAQAGPAALSYPALHEQLATVTEPGGDWKLAGHAEQLAPAAVQCVFAGHVSQAVASATRCAVPCLPAAHAEHEWLPASGL